MLLGLSWLESREGSERRVAILNPEPDYDFGEDEDLILLGRSGREPSLNRGTPIETSTDFPGVPYERAKLRKLLILGWNENIHQILMELDEHAVSELDVVIVSGQSEDHCKGF